MADTVALPPIPGEVWDAAGVWRDEDRGLGDLFTAIWPHLYAAALNSAAARFQADGAGPSARALRRMADEATRGESRGAYLHRTGE